MILGFDELQRRSGYKQATAIARWLKRNGIGFVRDAQGRPFTTVDALNVAMENRGSGKGWSPNFDASEKRRRKARAVLPPPQ